MSSTSTTTIQDKVYIISDALDESAQHIPEGTYLNAMNALRDISNQLQQTQRSSLASSLAPSLIRQLYTIAERNDFDSGIIMGCVLGVIGFIVGDILAVKFRV